MKDGWLDILGATGVTALGLVMAIGRLFGPAPRGPGTMADQPVTDARLARGEEPDAVQPVPPNRWPGFSRKAGRMGLAIGADKPSTSFPPQSGLHSCGLGSALSAAPRGSLHNSGRLEAVARTLLAFPGGLR